MWAREKEMKEKFIRFAQWSQKNWLSIVTVLTLVESLFLCLVLISWLIGYYCNALLDTKFDLQSCLSGVTIIGASFISTIGLAGAGWVKRKEDVKEYAIRSEFNSIVGIEPSGEE